MKYKNFIYILLMILSFQIVLIAQKPLVISDLKINCQNIMVSKQFNKDIYFLGTIPNQNGIYQYMTLTKYSDGKISEIPLELYNNGNLEKFKVSAKDEMAIDANGNIYLLGNGIYKYNGNSWSVFRINDEFENFRKYTEIEISKDNKIWFLTEVRELIGENNMLGEYHTKLYRKSDEKLDLVYQENWGTLVFDKLFALENGKVAIQKIYNKVNPYDVKKYNFDSTLYDLWIYDENLNMEYDRVNTPSGEPFNNMNKRIISLTSNKNSDLFISLQSNFYSVIIPGTKYRQCCGGYAEKIDNKWQKYDTSYGFRFLENAYNSFSSHYNLTENKVLLIKLSESDYPNKIFDKKEKTVIDVKSNEIYMNSSVITVKDWENIAMLNEDLHLYCHNIIELEDNLWFINQHFIIIIPKSNFDNLMSVEDNKSIDNFIIYPNPVKEELYFEDKISINISSFKIIDNTGKIVLSNKFNSNNINVSDLTSGVYFIEFFDKYNNILKSAKFTKE